MRPITPLLLLAAVGTGCAGGPHLLAGPPQTTYRVGYHTIEREAVHAAVLQILERWKVRVRSDDGRILRTRPFKDGPSVWAMQVELEYCNGTTAVLVKMDILRGGSVEEDVVDTDFESIVRWQIGGDPDAFRLPADPGHSDRVKAELVDWLRRWRAGQASTSIASEEDVELRARSRRELFLGCLRMILHP
jgi:hypothetical protein